jgi:hypothetical protein
MGDLKRFATKKRTFQTSSNRKYLKIIPILIVFFSPTTATAITIGVSNMLAKRLKFHKMLPNDLSNSIYKKQ